MKSINITPDENWHTVEPEYGADDFLKINNADINTKDGIQLNLSYFLKNVTDVKTNNYTQMVLTDNVRMDNIFTPNIPENTKFPESFTTYLMANAFPFKTGKASFVKVIEHEGDENGRWHVIGNKYFENETVPAEHQQAIQSIFPDTSTRTLQESRPYKTDVNDDNGIYYTVTLVSENELTIMHDDNYAEVFLTARGNPLNDEEYLYFATADESTVADRTFKYLYNPDTGFLALYRIYNKTVTLAAERVYYGEYVYECQESHTSVMTVPPSGTTVINDNADRVTHAGVVWKASRDHTASITRPPAGSNDQWTYVDQVEKIDTTNINSWSVGTEYKGPTSTVNPNNKWKIVGLTSQLDASTWGTQWTGRRDYKIATTYTQPYVYYVQSDFDRRFGESDTDTGYAVLRLKEAQSNSILRMGELSTDTPVPSTAVFRTLPYNKNSKNLKINNHWVSYSTFGEQNNLNINEKKSFKNVFNNFLFTIPYKTITATTGAYNVLQLKNQLTPDYELSRANPFPNYRGCDHREYDKIFTGTNQIKGTEQLSVGYNSYVTTIDLPPDQITYFNAPQDMYPTKRINLNDSGLIEAGAIGGDTPIVSDKIFKKAADYKYNTPYGAPSDEESGVWLCSWLKANIGTDWDKRVDYKENTIVNYENQAYKAKNDNKDKQPDINNLDWEKVTGGDPVWVDRYYNPNAYSAEEALKIEGQYYDYTSKFEYVIQKFNAEDEYVFDKRSDLTFEPGSLYAYYHIGPQENQSIIDTEKLSLVHEGIDPIYYQDRTLYANIENKIKLNGTIYIETAALNKTTNSDFTASINIDCDDWSKPIGSQLIGNYTNQGFGLYNKLNTTPFVVMNDDSKVYVMNTDLQPVVTLEPTTALANENIEVIKAFHGEGCENMHVYLKLYDTQPDYVRHNPSGGDVIYEAMQKHVGVNTLKPGLGADLAVYRWDVYEAIQNDVSSWSRRPGYNRGSYDWEDYWIRKARKVYRTGGWRRRPDYRRYGSYVYECYVTHTPSEYNPKTPNQLMGDLVTHNGVIYRCVKTHTAFSLAPDDATNTEGFWEELCTTTQYSNLTNDSAPAAWSDQTDYTETIWRLPNYTTYNGQVYYCKRSHSATTTTPDANTSYWDVVSNYTGPAPQLWKSTENYVRLGWYYWYRSWSSTQTSNYNANDFLYFYIGLLWHNFRNGDRVDISGIPSSVADNINGVHYVRRHGWWAIALYEDANFTTRSNVQIHDQAEFDRLARYADISQQPALPGDPKPLVFNPGGLSDRHDEITSWKTNIEYSAGTVDYWKRIGAVTELTDEQVDQPFWVIGDEYEPAGFDRYIYQYDMKGMLVERFKLPESDVEIVDITLDNDCYYITYQDDTIRKFDVNTEREDLLYQYKQWPRYVVGDSASTVLYRDFTYRCIKAHEAVADVIQHNSYVYRCIKTHSASADREPGTGDDYQEFWTRLGRIEELGRNFPYWNGTRNADDTYTKYESIIGKTPGGDPTGTDPDENWRDYWLSLGTIAEAGYTPLTWEADKTYKIGADDPGDPLEIGSFRDSNKRYIELHDDNQYRINCDTYTIDMSGNIWFVKDSKVYKTITTGQDGINSSYQETIDGRSLHLISEESIFGETQGNQIKIVGDGVTTVEKLIAKWNDANPGNQVASLSESGLNIVLEDGFEVQLDGGADRGADTTIYALSGESSYTIPSIKTDTNNDVWLLTQQTNENDTTKQGMVVYKLDEDRRSKFTVNLNDLDPELPENIVCNGTMDLVYEFEQGVQQEYAMVLLQDPTTDTTVYNIKINMDGTLKETSTVTMDFLAGKNITTYKNITNHEIVRRFHPAEIITGNYLTYKFRFQSYFDTDKTYVKHMHYDISKLTQGDHHFAISFNSLNGNLSMLVDGELQIAQVSDDVFTGAAYKYTKTIHNPLFVGCDPFFNNITLSEYLNQQNYYFCKDITIDSIRVYNKYLNYHKIRALTRENKEVQTVKLTLPTGKRTYVDQIVKYYLNEKPGRKSNYFDVNVTSNTITATDVQQTIEYTLREELEQKLPANTYLNKINWTT